MEEKNKKPFYIDPITGKKYRKMRILSTHLNFGGWVTLATL